MLDRLKGIWVVGDARVPPVVLERLAARFAQAAGPLQVRVQAEATGLLPGDAEGRVAWDDLFSACDQVRKQTGLGADQVVVLVTSQPNELLWFSAGQPDGTPNLFLHTGDWEWLSTASLDAVLAHELVENVLEWGVRRRFPDLDLETELSHDPPIGCISDLCMDKEDVRLKHRTADICGLCLERLEAAGATPAMLRQVFEVLEGVRAEALASARFRISEGSLPFPIAVWRHRVRSAAGDLHRLMVLLGYFDVLVRLAVLTSRTPLAVPATPSLGWWVSQLGGAGAEARRAAHIAERELIVSIRNEWVGHGLPRLAEGDYRSVADEVRDSVSAVEAVLLPTLARRRLLLVHGVEVRPKRLLLQVRPMEGASPFWSLEPVEITAEQVPLGVAGKVVLQDDHLRDLDHGVRFQLCPKCEHERVLLCDGQRWIDVQLGHRVRIRG